MITVPPTCSRRMRLGEPTSSEPSGVIVAAFSPNPASHIARAASCTTELLVWRRLSRDRSKRSISSARPSTSGESTRRACSKSSCPVWSLSSTTILSASLTAGRRFLLVLSLCFLCRLAPKNSGPCHSQCQRDDSSRWRCWARQSASER
jgi:hypothetical protein